MALARSTGRALAANVKTSNRPAVNVLGIITNGNRPGFAVVLASIDALQGRDSLWRVSSQQARRNLPASRPRSWPVNELRIVTNSNRPGFAVVLANIDALHGRDSLWCVPGQQAGRYLPTSTPCTAGDPGIATSGNRPGFALVNVRSTSRALPANVNALQGW